MNLAFIFFFIKPASLLTDIKSVLIALTIGYGTQHETG